MRSRKNKKNNNIPKVAYLLLLLVGFGIGHMARPVPGADEQSVLLAKASNLVYIPEKDITHRFSPTPKKDAAQGCTQMVVDLINKTYATLTIGIFALTSKSIVLAIEDACSRGVQTTIFIDKKFTGVNSPMQRLFRAGAQIYVYRGPYTYHLKCLVSDGKIMETGSFNYSANAERRNRENASSHVSEPIAKIYLDELKRHQGLPDFHPYGDLNRARS
ncbi:MAG: phospholipase D-like domain-containing protein [Cytophagales bacterium]